MSKSENTHGTSSTGADSRRVLHPPYLKGSDFSKGKNKVIFIGYSVICLIVMAVIIYAINNVTAESAGSRALADSNFKNPPVQTRFSDSLSGGSSFPPDRFYGDHTGADYPDTMVLLDSIVDKLLILESGGRPNPPDGDGGDAVGPLQLHKEVLRDVNKYFEFNFKPDDRKDLAKSKLIAKAYITMWIMENNEEIGVRIFNGGPRGWRSEATDNYWQKYKEISVSSVNSVAKNK